MKKLLFSLILTSYFGSFSQANEYDYAKITETYFKNQGGNVGSADYKKCMGRLPANYLAEAVKESEVLSFPCPRGDENTFKTELGKEFKSLSLSACKNMKPGSIYTISLVPDTRGMFDEEGLLDVNRLKGQDKRYCLYTSKNMQCFTVPKALLNSNTKSLFVTLGDRELPMRFYPHYTNIASGPYYYIRSAMIFNSADELRKDAKEWEKIVEGATKSSPKVTGGYFDIIKSLINQVNSGAISKSGSVMSTEKEGKVQSLKLDNVSEKEAQEILEKSSLAYFKVAKALDFNKERALDIIKNCADYAKNKPGIQRALCNLLASSEKCPIKLPLESKSQSVGAPRSKTVEGKK